MTISDDLGGEAHFLWKHGKTVGNSAKPASSNKGFIWLECSWYSGYSLCPK